MESFTHLYTACRVDHGQRDTMVVNFATQGDRYALDVDDRRVLLTSDRNELFVTAAREIDAATVTATRHSCLLLHASSIATNDGVVLITGPSGAGKSTSAAALTCAGYEYVADEVIGVSLDSIEAIANPKPFKLDGRARRALRSNFPTSRVRVDTEFESLVSGRDLGASLPPQSTAPIMLVVEVAYRHAAPTRAETLSRGDVAEVLADQCFNFATWGRRALDAVAAIARTSGGVRLEIGSTACAVGEIARLVA